MRKLLFVRWSGALLCSHQPVLFVRCVAAGKPWPGTVPMQIPTKETYDKVQGDPTLTERKPDVLREFEAAPWLLPPRTKALKYAGVHKLDELLSLRSIPQGNYNKTITLMTFTVPFAMLTQNTSESWG